MQGFTKFLSVYCTRLEEKWHRCCLVMTERNTTDTADLHYKTPSYRDTEYGVSAECRGTYGVRETTTQKLFNI